jgi:DNA-binding LacI/PurR family transcriptional regulator
MKKYILHFLKFLLIFGLIIISTSCSKETETTKEQKKENKVSSGLIKIGFIVRGFNDKDSLEAINTIDKFAASHNIEVIETASITNKSLLKNMDFLGSKGAKGIIISAPDPRLGSAIASRSERLGIKIISIRNKLVNMDGSFMQKIPYLGISLEKTSNLIADTILKILNDKKWNISKTAIILLNENPNTSFQNCIELIDNNLNKRGISDHSIISETPIPSPDGLILSPTNLSKAKSHKYKNIIIYGFDMDIVIKLIGIFKKSYNYPLDNVVGFSTDFSSDFSEVNVPSNYYGSIYINPREYGYKATELLYNWIIEDKKPPVNTVIPTNFINNPKFK